MTISFGNIEVSKGKMLHFDLSSPVDMLWFGEFISPQKDWKHLTRRLFEYEMMIVTEGELYIADDDREYHVKDGEYLIMSPTRVQRGTRVCRCRFFWMHFRCDALPASVSLPPHAAYRDRENIFSLAHMLLRSEAEHPRSVIMFLPTEGLYAEIMRKSGLAAEIQSKYRISVAGPSTLGAFLNSLQMGFRTLAIQKRSGEVWRLLNETKTEFGKYADWTDKIRKNIEAALKVVDEAQTRTRAVNRKLDKLDTIDEFKTSVENVSAGAVPEELSAPVLTDRLI